MSNNSKLDALFIFPPLTLYERYGERKVGNVGGFLPPLGISYIASFLRQSGYNVDVIDALSLQMTEEEIINAIKAKDPKVIGLSSLTPMFNRAVQLSKKIQECFPEKLIIIGGQHATIMTREVLSENECFDIVVCGEGENTVLGLMNSFRACNYDKKELLGNADCLSKIKGIAFRNCSTIVQNPAGDHIKDLDTLPFPAWDLLPMEKYIPLPNQYLRQPVVHMITTRGCPFVCSFCSCNAVFGRAIRSHSPQRVIESIKHVMEKYGTKEISFWDDTITVNKKWIKDVCRRMIDEKLDITWTCLSRVDTIDREMVSLMKRAGCWNIFFGFEAGNQELLDNIKKGIKVEQSKKVMKWMKEEGIEVRASFMLALPGETPEMAEETIKFAIELDPDYAQFSVTTPYPGTSLYDNVEQYGSLSKDYSKYSLWSPVFVPYGYKDSDEVAKMEKRAIRKFYFRPKFIYSKFSRIKSFEDMKRYYKGFKMAIGLGR